MRYANFRVGYSVLIAGGAATPYPGRRAPEGDDIESADPGSGYAGRAAFIGGRTYTITAGEQAILEAAGYSVDP